MHQKRVFRLSYRKRIYMKRKRRKNAIHLWSAFLNNQIRIKGITEYIRVYMHVSWLSWYMKTTLQHTGMSPVQWLVWDTSAVKKY